MASSFNPSASTAWRNSLNSPALHNLFRVAGQSPAPLRAGRLVVAGIVRAAFEIIHKMGHDVRGAGLPRELEIFAREHVTIQVPVRVA